MEYIIALLAVIGFVYMIKKFKEDDTVQETKEAEAPYKVETPKPAPASVVVTDDVAVVITPVTSVPAAPKAEKKSKAPSKPKAAPKAEKKPAQSKPKIVPAMKAEAKETKPKAPRKPRNLKIVK
jgi:hypothetical protein